MFKAATFIFFYKISESSFVSPINTREKRKVMQYLDASLVSMLSAYCLQKTSLNSKPIPQFHSTNYLALISRSCSTRIRCQTFSNSWVEQNLNFRALAARLIKDIAKRKTPFFFTLKNLSNKQQLFFFTS